MPARQFPIDTTARDGRVKRAGIYEFQGNRIYSGWEAIATGMGRSKAGVKRLHEVYGMPVIRMTGMLVWTTQSAIDRWIIDLSNAQRRVANEMREEEIAENGHAHNGKLRRRYRNRMLARGELNP